MAEKKTSDINAQNKEPGKLKICKTVELAKLIALARLQRQSFSA